MGKFRTNYIVIQGSKEDFERELNQLIDKGYYRQGDLIVVSVEKKIVYSQLMSIGEPSS